MDTSMAVASDVADIDTTLEDAVPVASTSKAPADAEGSAKISEGSALSTSLAAATQTLDRNHIQAGDVLLLQLPNESTRLVRLTEQSTIYLGRYGSFRRGELVGHPYGVTLELVPLEDQTDAAGEDEDGADALQGKGKGKGRQQQNGKKSKKGAVDNDSSNVLCKLVRKDNPSELSLQETIDTEATNELIKATGAKTLSHEEIVEMKRQGVSGQEIIERQIQEHEAFKLKNEYSKAKYRKFKESKYLKYITPVQPTVFNICQYYFESDSRKIRELRPDSLAQMLSLANVRPGARLMIVDDSGGLLTAAAAERLVGEGLMLVLHANDSPPANQLLPFFNMPEAFTDKRILRDMHWGHTDPSFEAFELPAEPEDKAASERERLRFRKRRAVQELAASTKQEYQDGQFDALLVVSNMDSLSIVNTVLPALAGSAQIVIHSPTLQTLSSTLHSLLNFPSILNPTIIEPFMRQYQVLPGRTHPEMNGIGHGGYILHATRVFDDGSTASVRPSVGRKKQKRR